jgi:hypothetical protein
MVRAMSERTYPAVIACLGAVTLLLATEAALARSGAVGARGAFAAMHPAPHHFPFHHHGRGRIFPFWPGDTVYAPDGTPLVEQAPPSNDIHYTYTYDVPWDWAHRFPPMVAPSDRPYVPGCATETVTVPGRGGGERSVNVTRCY